MSAQKLNKINLLPKDSFEESILGKFLAWSLSSGRMIVILTEFIVVIAFGSRFWFDQKLNDLLEEIEAKETVVESYVAVEEQMRDILTREKEVDEFLKNNLGLTLMFSSLKRATPPDVLLESFVIENNQIKLEGIAGSETSFDLFLNNLGFIPGVNSIRLGKTVFDQKSDGVKFEISAKLINRQ